MAHTSAANATAVRVTSGLLSATTIAHSTIVATGTGSKGLDTGGIAASTDVTSSAVQGAAADAQGDGLLGSLTIGFSAYRSGTSSNVTSSGSNRNGTGTFVNAAGLNFQQDPASITVNTGDNSDNSTVDVDGRQRTIAEGTDIGAYELPIPPNATTGASSLVTGTTARVAASVNPRGTATTYEIRYDTSSPPSTAWPSASAGSGTSNVAYNTDLTGLTPATTYYYRVAATNTWGTTLGSIQSFTTPAVAPTATTDAASLITATGARLNGRVNPGGAATSAQFEWGTTPAYGNTTGGTNVGSSNSNQNVSQDLGGLTPSTTYYYRVTASNTKGSITAAQGTFTTPSRAPITSVGATTGITPTAATLNGTVDPGGASTAWQFDYGVGAYDNSSGSGNLTGTTQQAVNTSLSSLLPGTTYQFRLVAQNSDGTTTSTGTFNTQVAQPTATTGAAGSVTARGATVAGTLNPGGDAATYRVEYGLTTSYGQSTASANVADGTSNVAASRTLSGLEPGTVYHYRLVVTNSAGTAQGADGTFTTAVSLPGVSTDRATGVTQTGARLVGAVNAGGGSTTWEFEYGRTTAYGKSTATTTLTASNDDEVVGSVVEGLEPGVTYHFRLVAHNAAGDTIGDDATFTTAGSDPGIGTADPGTGGQGDDPVDPGDPVTEVPGDDPSTGPVQADGLPTVTPTPPVGRAANAAPASGTIEVKLPGTDEFVRLTEGASIPMGSIVDATNGQVKITSAADAKGNTQTANFGGSQFRITQKRAARPLTDITLVGGDFSDCFPRVLGKGTADVFAAGAAQVVPPSPVGQRPRPLPHPRPARRGYRARHPLADRGPLRRHARPGPPRPGRGARPGAPPHRDGRAPASSTSSKSLRAQKARRKGRNR